MGPSPAHKQGDGWPHCLVSKVRSTVGEQRSMRASNLPFCLIIVQGAKTREDFGFSYCVNDE